MIDFMRLTMFMTLFSFQFLKAQDLEFKLVKRFGFPTNEFHDDWAFQSFDQYKENKMIIPYAQENAHRLRAVSENGIALIINKELFGKGRIHGVIGLEYARTNYEKWQFFIKDFNNLFIHHDRASLNFGGFKRFSFFNEKLIFDIGLVLQKRFYFNQIQSFEQNEIRYNSSINLASELITYRDKFYPNEGNKSLNLFRNFHFEFNSNISFRLDERIYINAGFDYNRNNIFYYDYFAVGFEEEWFEGEGWNTSVFRKDPYEGDNGAKEKVKSHFKYFTIGLTVNLQRP